MISILVIEKDNEIKKQIDSALNDLGYRAAFVSNNKDALKTLEESHFQMVIANYANNACDLCKELRQLKQNTPFIILVEKASPKDKRKIFKALADGYLEIPFDSEELQMRIQNLFWRCRIEDSVDVKYGNATLHSETFTIEIGENIIELRKMEFLLLEKLLSYPGRIFTRKQLMDELWGYDCESDHRTVDTHIRLLRKKLKNEDSIRIQTIRGIGYRAAVPKN